MVILGAAIGALAVWVYLVWFRGNYWREFVDRRMTDDKKRSSVPLGVVVPARDEAAVVGKAIGSLARQEYAGEFHIFLVDDGSGDLTADAARAAAPEGQLTVVPGVELPAGWTGKLWAVSQGVREAEHLRPDYFLLTDADIVHPDDSLQSLVALAVSGPYDLVSYMATLACRTPAERALAPAFVYFFFLLYPPAWIRNPRRGTAGAAGGCMLIRREMLERIGGLEAIRGAWIDDCALAAAVKAKGGRVWLGVNRGLASIRSYESFGEAERMISRSAFTQLRHSWWLLLGTVAGLCLTYLVPPVVTLFAPQPAKGIAAMAWLLMSISYLPALRFYGRSWLGAPLLPLVALFYMTATVESAVSHWLRGGPSWKGRGPA